MNDPRDFLIALFAFGFALVGFPYVFKAFKGMEERREQRRTEKLKELGETLCEIERGVDTLHSRITGCEDGVGRIEDSLEINLKDRDYDRLRKIEKRLEALENENGWQYQGNGEYAERRPNGDSHSR